MKKLPLVVLVSVVAPLDLACNAVINEDPVIDPSDAASLESGTEPADASVSTYVPDEDVWFAPLPGDAGVGTEPVFDGGSVGYLLVEDVPTGTGGEQSVASAIFESILPCVPEVLVLPPVGACWLRGSPPTTSGGPNQCAPAPEDPFGDLPGLSAGDVAISGVGPTVTLSPTRTSAGISYLPRVDAPLGGMITASSQGLASSGIPPFMVSAPMPTPVTVTQPTVGSSGVVPVSTSRDLVVAWDNVTSFPVLVVLSVNAAASSFAREVCVFDANQGAGTLRQVDVSSLAPGSTGSGSLFVAPISHRSFNAAGWQLYLRVFGYGLSVPVIITP
jgi:hypothetical protein